MLIEKIKALLGIGKKKQIWATRAEYATTGFNLACIDSGWTSTLAIFDPDVLWHRSQEENWWQVEPATEMAQGNFAIVETSFVTYEGRITSDDLTEAEKALPKVVTPEFGVKVQSGQLVIGGGECLPSIKNGVKQPFGNDFDDKVIILTLPSGYYRVRIFTMFDMPDDEYIYTPRYVIQLKPTPDKVLMNTSEKNVHILGVYNDVAYLKGYIQKGDFSDLHYESMCYEQKRYLHAKVFKNTKTGVLHLGGEIFCLPTTPPYLYLGWPTDYNVILEDWRNVKFKDRLVLSITDIDRNKKIVKVQVEEVLEK